MVNYDFKFLKQQIAEQEIRNRFQNSSITMISFIHNIYNEAMRDTLEKEYVMNISDTPENRMTFCLDTAKEYVYQCKEQYNFIYNQLLLNEKTLPIEEQLTSTMLHWLEERLINIGERIQYIYESKLERLKMRTSAFIISCTNANKIH